ncbi:MAG: DUF262 domain-containing protein [Bacteroidota bacterium]|nr:DUF262 domain-containing protein [Bacteroidota bacterium]
MNNRTEFKSIKEFLFQENRTFIIPNYQRGYKWAVKLKDEKLTAVEKLIRDFKSANKQQEYFLQGVTVAEDGENIILIDGQQRTTTLYLLLWALEYEKFKEINLQYDIREKSKEFINDLKKEKPENFNDNNIQKGDIQDVFYFKEAIKQIKTEIEKIEDKDKFLKFILDKVTIIYIVIDKDKATKTFSMMNGAKATMLQEELVKAEMLRKISIPDIEDKQVSSSVEENLYDLKEIITKDWETNALRSRYAREWDKWLYWWNRKDVKDFFNIESPMGLLLDYFYKRKEKNDKTEFSFDNFKGLITENKKTGKQKTKLIFKELRDLQKSFEDVFNNEIVYNYLGLSLIEAGIDKSLIINYFIDNKNEDGKLRQYSLCRLVGATHNETIEKENNLNEKVSALLSAIKDDYIYFNNISIANKLLLYFNVNEDINLQRKFDFSIWQSKSLEHIFPKSKVYHKDEQEELVDGNSELLNSEKFNAINDGTWLNRDKFKNEGSEHCIGNLVLLYGNNNSEFGAKSVKEKKKRYFEISQKFESRHLLHTISVFAKDNWGTKEIQENKKLIIVQFEKDYDFIIKKTKLK